MSDSPPVFEYVYLFMFVVYSASVSVVSTLVRKLLLTSKLPNLDDRLGEGLPVVIGAAGAFIPGVIPEALPGPPALYGVLAGAFSGQCYAWVKRNLKKASQGKLSLPGGESGETKPVSLPTSGEAPSPPSGAEELPEKKSAEG